MNRPRKYPKVLHMTTVAESLLFLENQLKYMRSQGFDVHVLSSPGRELDRFAKIEGVRPHHIQMERQISPLKDLRSLWKIWRLMRREGFDIVHVHTPKAGLLGILAAFFAGIRVRLYHIHGLVYPGQKGLKKKILYYSEKLTCRLADAAYAVSPSLKNYLIQEGVVSEKKVRLLENGSINGLDWEQRFNRDTYLLSKANNMYRITEQDFVIGFVGRLVRDKGIVELMKAYDELSRQFPNVKLLILGKMEAEDAYTNMWLKEIETNDSMIHLGYLDDPAPLYSLMDVLVFPTYREGFGLVAIEAMSMGVPVIASEVLGCMDTVEDGQSGFLIPPRNVSEIVEKVTYYMENEEVRVQHGRYGRQVVAAKYDQQAIWNGMVKEYKSLIRSM